ncbi:hypothetical protein LCO01nite_00620 [Lapidilactobacillus concavus]|nr:hypothetical protein LCO01nite_00620 [Lapidilactobacillus concavus]
MCAQIKMILIKNTQRVVLKNIMLTLVFNRLQKGFVLDCYREKMLKGGKK